MGSDDNKTVVLSIPEHEDLSATSFQIAESSRLPLLSLLTHLVTRTLNDSSIINRCDHGRRESSGTGRLKREV